MTTRENRRKFGKNLGKWVLEKEVRVGYVRAEKSMKSGNVFM